MDQKTLEKAAKFVRKLEGCKLKAYQDTGGVWTIGVGHTGDDVCQGIEIDENTALYLLEVDLHEAYQAVDELVDVPLTDGETVALISFVFNIGRHAFENSTLRVLLNNRDYEGASRQFGRWNKDNGVVVIGLTNRRTQEREMFDREERPEAA